MNDELKKIGLTENQATVYLVLIKNRPLRVQELVQQTGIPRSSVYEVLKHLFTVGLAEEITEDTHKMIKGLPISTLKHQLDGQIAELQQQVVMVEQLEPALALLAEVGAQPAMEVRRFKGVSGAQQLLWNSLKAQDTVCVYSAWGRSGFVGKPYYERFVQESKIRGVNERVLVNPSPAVIDAINVDQGTALSRTNPKDIRSLPLNQVVIKGETFIYDNVYAQVYLSNDEIHGFEIENQDFVTTQRSIFETLWRIAEPIS